MHLSEAHSLRLVAVSARVSIHQFCFQCRTVALDIKKSMFLSPC